MADPKELIKFPSMGEIPKPVWVDVSNTEGFNKFLDESVGVLYKDYIDPTYTTIMAVFNVVQEVLDIIASLIPEFTDPISALLKLIADFVEAYLKDLQQLGVYITYDNALKGEFKLKNFAGGYNRVASEITKKATNPQDFSRPDVSKKTAVVSLTAYGGAGLTGAGGVGVLRVIEIIKAFLGLFGVEEIQGGFLPPQVSPPLVLTQVFGIRNTLEAETLDFLDVNPIGFTVRWQMPQGKTLTAFEVNLPPGAFVVTVSSRAKPLFLYVEKKAETSTSSTATEIHPVYVRGRLATTSHLNRFNFDSSIVDDPSKVTANNFFLFARVGDKKVPAKNFLNETISFYKETSNLGALFGQTTFEMDIEFEENLKDLRIYDATNGSEQRVTGDYYISIASYPKEAESLESDLDVEAQLASANQLVEVNPEESKGEGFDFYLNVGKGNRFSLSTDPKSLSPLPEESNRVTAKAIYPSKLNYISALREAYTHFFIILLDELSIFATKGVLAYESQASEQLVNSVTSLIGLKDPMELAQKFNALGTEDSVSGINKFRSEMKKLVDKAVGRSLELGEPSGLMSVVKPFIDTILDDSDYPLLYPTLDYEFSGLDEVVYKDDSGLTQLVDLDKVGLLTSALDLTFNYFSEPSDVQGFFPYANFAHNSTTQGRSNRKVALERFTAHDLIINEPIRDQIINTAPRYLPFLFSLKEEGKVYGNYVEFHKLINKYPDRWVACQKVLGFTPETQVEGDGEWINFRLFSEGFNGIDELFEQIIGAIKSLIDGFDSLVKFILQAIDLLKKRIESIRNLIVKIKAIIDAILALRLPGGLSYLLTISEGTEGYVQAINTAQNPPESGKEIYGTYATLVFATPVPTFVVQLLLGMLGESGLETVKDVFEGGVGIDEEGNFVPATSTGLQSLIIKEAKELNAEIVKKLEGGIDYIEEVEDFKESLQGVTESAQTTRQGILNTLPNNGNED